MLFAQKSNRVHPIQESEVQHYLNQGYNITDVKGNVIIESMPEDVISLKAAFKRHTDEIAKAKETIKAYDAQVVALLETNNQLSVRNEELEQALEQAEKARATKTTKASKKSKKDEEVVEETAETESNE